MKKFFLFTLVIICFLAVGCEKSGFSTLGSNSKKTSEQQIIQNNNSNFQNQNKAKTSINEDNISSAASSTNSKLKEASNLMDNLDSTLNGLDNSSDINTTESIINNIN